MPPRPQWFFIVLFFASLSSEEEWNHSKLGSRSKARVAAACAFALACLLMDSYRRDYRTVAGLVQVYRAIVLCENQDRLFDMAVKGGEVLLPTKDCACGSFDAC